MHVKTRPIIAKIVQFKERQLVRKAAYTKLKGEQNGNYGINEQFPRENNEKRKKMKKNVVPVGFYHKIWFICLIRNPF